MASRAEFGLWVTDKRRAQGLTQLDLSEMSGVSRGSISYIENGRRLAPARVVAVLACCLGEEPIPVLRRFDAEHYSWALESDKSYGDVDKFYEKYVGAPDSVPDMRDAFAAATQVGLAWGGKKLPPHRVADLLKQIDEMIG